MSCLYPLDSSGSTASGEQAVEVRPAYPSGVPTEYSHSQLLGHYFASAPAWQDVHDVRERARACINHLVGTAGHEVPPQSGVGTGANVSKAAWTRQYLVKVTKAFSCGDTKYGVDVTSRLLGFLPDGTFLLAGARAVLRVTASDGSTHAPVTVVRAINLDHYIDALRRDGGPSCTEAQPGWACKWVKIGQGIRGRQPSAAAEQAYGKYWFQGFNHAIGRLFF